MKKAILLLVLFLACWATVIQAQGLSDAVRTTLMKKPPGEAVSVLNIDRNYTDAAIKQMLPQSAYFDYNTEKAGELIERYPETMTMEIAINSREKYVLDLISSASTFKDLIVTTGSGKTINLKKFKAAYYRGVVRGLEQETVVGISIFENQMSGVIFGKNTNIVIGKLKNSDKHIVYKDSDMEKDLFPTCDMDDPPLNDQESELYNDALNSIYNGMISKCVELYYETEYDIYQTQGNNTNNVIAWVTSIHNNVAALYAAELIQTAISEIKVWDVQDPYNASSTAALLSQFQGQINTLNGDLGQLLTSRSIGGGRAAGFSGLCNGNSDNSLSVSGHMTTTFPNVPTFSWNVEVVTHEFGHLFGSRHTHACVWNGNNTAIDGCAGATEGGCPLPPVPSGGGTIMSYCHTKPVGINFALGFGPQPGNVIRANVQNATCLDACCDENQSPAFTVEIDCNGGNWSVTATPFDETPPNHWWGLYQTTVQGATSGGTLVATQTGSTANFQWLDQSKAYYIVHRIWAECYDAKEASVAVPTFASNATLSYTLEDGAGAVKNHFCFGETIYLDGTASNNYDRYNLYCRRRPAGSPAGTPFVHFADYGWVMSNAMGIINLNNEFQFHGDNPGEIFEPGYEYEIQVAIANPPHCIPWVELKKTFTVECCPTTPNFTVSINCNGGNWTVTATPNSNTPTNHVWQLFQTTVQGATSGGTLVSTQNGNTANFQWLDQSRFFYITHTISMPGCYNAQSTSVAVPTFASNATASYTLEDVNGVVKDQFCVGEDIYLDGTLSTNYDRYFLAVWRRPIAGGAFTYYADYGWTFTNNIGIINLSQMFLNGGAHPGDVFEPGYVYELQFAIANPSNCVPWIELKKQFTVTCCDGFISANFKLNLEQGEGYYSLVAFDFETYGANVTHQWTVLSSPNPDGGPYTHVLETTTSGPGPFVLYDQAVPGLYYFVVHKVTTLCGDFCYGKVRYGYGDFGESQPDEAGESCELCGEIDCDILDNLCLAPNGENAYCNPFADGVTFVWNPVPGATQYKVQITFNDPDCCRSGLPNTLTYTTYNTNMYLGYLERYCFSWRIGAVCNGQTQWAEKHCFTGCDQTSGTPGGGIGLAQQGGNDEIEVPVEHQALVYPNPATDEVNIALPLTVKASSMRMLDMQGKVVYDLLNPDANLTIDVSGLANGMYAIQVVFEDGSQTVNNVVVKH